MLLLASLAALLAAQDPEALPNPRLSPEVLVVRAAAPSVVYIEAVQAPRVVHLIPGLVRPRTITGSGVVIDKSGFIVTNNHIVEGANEIHVEFDPEQDTVTYVAELVSQQPGEDLALLKIKGEKEFPVVRMGTSSDLMIGERVIVIGNPYRQRLSASSGIIAGLHRNLTVGNLTFPDLIQTDASINPGNSGGPMLNVLGEMIGMTTAQQHTAENMGFAIPIDRIKEVLADELFAPTAARAFLGFDLDQRDPSAALVAHVTPAGPADKAGVRAGDRVLGLNGEKIADAHDFNIKHLLLKPGGFARVDGQKSPVQPVRLEVERDKQAVELLLLPWKKTEGLLFERLGMTVEQVAVGGYTLIAVDVLAPDGPAREMGLQPGDILEAFQVEGRRPTVISSGTALARWVSAFPQGTRIALDVLRDDDKDGRLDHRQELYKGEISLR